MRVLETSRLLLKPVEEGDLLALLELQWDKDVTRFMKFTPLTMDNQRTWLKNLGSTSIAFTINVKQDDGLELIGLGALNNIDRVNQRASWGMKLKSNLQGKGLGFEASLMIIHYGFYYQNLHKIHADYLQENLASEKLTVKIGLRKEALQIDHLYHCGIFKNVIQVGILKDEFYQMNQTRLTELGLM